MRCSGNPCPVVWKAARPVSASRQLSLSLKPVFQVPARLPAFAFPDLFRQTGDRIMGGRHTLFTYRSHAHAVFLLLLYSPAINFPLIRINDIRRLAEFALVGGLGGVGRTPNEPHT